MRRNIVGEFHDDFRAAARAFFECECVPNTAKWERDGKVSREAWEAASEHGLLDWALPEAHDGLGVDDFWFKQIVAEAMFATGAIGIRLGVHNDILVLYLCDLTTDESHLSKEHVEIACAAASPSAHRGRGFIKSYALERTAFGQPIGTHQVSRHFLPEMQTKLVAAQIYLDQYVLALNAGELTAEDAAALKWCTSEVQWQIWTAVCRCMADIDISTNTRSRSCGAMRDCSESTVERQRS
ncbi:hypothetical protein MMOR_58920 [Mycolicibacterium moriokaense]|jgi:alkylation response protein AidB-like acyl-CoA dehydrogenase|uniref:Acyl-CoA dehydrogenase/oxidase N-terminal domain-containing protein n=1 Tax=Mycolicibacterium moriokaense TaxID=39691 RepID=A0AAD1HIQ4_9MYCO|nr:hypothetical protein MMOR_58920 [Mycolicibacterium moriokaense]